MNALNEHRHGFSLGFVSQVFAAVSVERAGNNVADFQVAFAKKFSNGEISRLNLDNKDPATGIDEHHGASHAGISIHSTSGV
jgi:hypothetical protein